jgi:hypothetical protein
MEHTLMQQLTPGRSATATHVAPHMTLHPASPAAPCAVPHRATDGARRPRAAWAALCVLAALLPACVVAPLPPPVVVVEEPPPEPPPAPVPWPEPPRRPPPPAYPPPPPRQPLPRPEAHRVIHGVHVPPDRVPREGACRLWFADVPPDRQPASMSCGRARREAQRTGGWVIWALGPQSYRSGAVAAEDFGPHGLHGVPPDRLPPPGRCRLWFDGAPPDRQPPPGPCQAVIRRQGAEGGRVLYMPASDLRR